MAALGGALRVPLPAMYCLVVSILQDVAVCMRCDLPCFVAILQTPQLKAYSYLTLTIVALVLFVIFFAVAGDDLPCSRWC